MRKCQLEPARSGQASVPASLVPGCWVNSWFLTVTNAPHVFPVVFQTSSGTAAPAAEQDPFPEPLFGLAPGNDLNLAAFNLPPPTHTYTHSVCATDRAKQSGNVCSLFPPLELFFFFFAPCLPFMCKCISRETRIRSPHSSEEDGRVIKYR